MPGKENKRKQNDTAQNGIIIQVYKNISMDAN